MPLDVEHITFPDAEAAVIAGLADELAPIPVASKIASRGLCVRVLRTGTGYQREFILDPAQITLDVYAPTETDAESLARRCLSTILTAGRAGELGGEQIYPVDRLGGPTNLPDPGTSRPRYTLSFIIPFRGKGS